MRRRGERTELEGPKQNDPILLAEIERLKQRMDKMQKSPTPPISVDPELESPLVKLLL